MMKEWIICCNKNVIVSFIKKILFSPKDSKIKKSWMTLKLLLKKLISMKRGKLNLLKKKLNLKSILISLSKPKIKLRNKS